MTTTRSVITPSIPTDLTTVYTNSSTGGAVLKSLNINGIADSSVFTETTGASEWSYFGAPNPHFAQPHSNNTSGFGAPYPVQLSADRVLLFSLPHYQHYGHNADFMNNNVVHAQICEFQTNKYVAGPITNISLPSPVFSASNSLWTYPTSKNSANRGTGMFKAIALSPTVVVLAVRQGSVFLLARVNIVGNAVDVESLVSLDLTAPLFFNNTTPGDFDLSAVPGDTTKVIVGGWTSTNWSLQAINVPVTGALTSASTLFSTGIASSTAHFAIAPTSKNAISNVVTYFAAGCTSATSFNGQLVNFNISTNAFSIVGTATTYARSGNILGLLAESVSIGNDHDMVVAISDEGSPSNIFFVNQINNTQAVAAGTITSVALNHGTARGLIKSFKWGDERAVFLGTHNTLVGFNASAVPTNLILALDTADSSTVQTQWFPFNSRPLYSFYTTDSNFCAQYYTRQQVLNSNSFGIRQDTGTYFPYGHDYDQRQYVWSDVANCWIVGQGGKIYALDVNGVVQNEIMVSRLATSFNVNFTLRDLAISRTGQVVYAGEHSNTYSPSRASNTRWDSLINQIQTGVLIGVTSPASLTNASITGANNIGGFLGGKFYTFVDSTNTDVIYYNYYNTIANPAHIVARWRGNGTDLAYQNNIQLAGFGTATNNWHVGSRANHRLFLASPINSANPEGRWRVIGQLAWSSESNSRQLGCSIIPYTFGNFGSMDPASRNLTSTQVVNAYGISGNTNRNFSIVAAYDQALNAHRVMYSNNINYNMVVTDTLILPSTNQNTRFYKVTTSKYAATVSLSNVGSTNTIPTAYIYDTSNTLNPRITLTGTNGNGIINSTNVDKVSFAVFGTGINRRYAVSGPTETARVTVVATVNNVDFAITRGQPLVSNEVYRSTDTYLLPPGASIKVQSDTPNSISSMFTVVEEI
jgi:hypothetical protein